MNREKIDSQRGRVNLTLMIYSVMERKKCAVKHLLDIRGSPLALLLQAESVLQPLGYINAICREGLGCWWRMATRPSEPTAQVHLISMDGKMRSRRGRGPMPLPLGNPTLSL